MEKSEMIDKMLELLLTNYNGDSKTPVASNDTYFKSYLIGFLTWNLTEKQLKENIGYLEKKVA